MASGAKSEAMPADSGWMSPHRAPAEQSAGSLQALLFIRPADGRYYWIAPPAPDLFGDLVVECWYGSLHSRRGRHRCHAVTDLEAAARLVGKIGRLRRRHGYV